MSTPDLFNPATATAATSKIMFSLPTSSTSLLVLALILVLSIAIFTYFPASLIRWIQRKRYQYEVTFALYMLTPTEKFIFNSVLFLFLSMVIIAVALYLPRHVSIIAHRAYYYLMGDCETCSNGRISSSAAEIVIKKTVSAVETAVVGASTVPEL